MDLSWRQPVASLADPARLELFARIVLGAAADRPEPAVRTGDLTTAERRRLAPLLDAGLVTDDDGVLTPQPGRLTSLLADTARPHAAGPERFLTGGRLEALPRRESDRLELLTAVADRLLPAGAQRSGAEVTADLVELAADPVGIRRALVDYGLVERTADGSRYWRAPQGGAAPAPAVP